MGPLQVKRHSNATLLQFCLKDAVVPSHRIALDRIRSLFWVLNMARKPAKTAVLAKKQPNEHQSVIKILRSFLASL